MIGKNNQLKVYQINIFMFLAITRPTNQVLPRMFSILLSIAVTYVIGDMYSANLTSLLAKPGRGIEIDRILLALQNYCCRKTNSYFATTIYSDGRPKFRVVC